MLQLKKQQHRRKYTYVIGWQESLATIVEILVHILVLAGSNIAAIESRATQGVAADWLISTFVIHIFKLS